MTRTTHNPWLTGLAALTAVVTLGLICLGGLVTSHGVGMSVPDWPTTYGYNMFFFPISKWVGGVFYEHTHRLAASGVGLLTIALAVWLTLREARPWLRRLGWAALAAVILQGVLGGLRVTAMMDELGIVHAGLGQLFLVLVCAIALFCSQWWQRWIQSAPATPRPWRAWLLVVTGLTFIQLMIGATMRHQHAGLAIPDFPLAYGRLWPELGAEAIDHYNRLRTETMAWNDITAAQIVLQMAHRFLALGILAAVAWIALATRRIGVRTFSRLAWFWLGLIASQVLLGAATIWTNKSADVATAHVAVGALALVTGSMLCLITRPQPARCPKPCP